MDFTFSPEQLLIKDGVARFAAGQHDGDRWKTFAELGWLAIGAPEDLGGFGGPLETLLVMEQFGRGRVTSAYVAQRVFAGAILRAANRLDLLEGLIEGRERYAVAYEEPHARWNPAVITASARSERDGFAVNGTKTRVLDASTAQTFLTTARIDGVPALLAIPAATGGVTLMPYPAEDGSDVADVVFRDVTVGTDAGLARGDEVIAIVELGFDHAVAALCAEALGLMSVMLETTVEYSKQRQQFGVPIGSFQALQHRMADMFIEVELARSMAYLAAMTLEGGDDVARRRGISAAKVQIAKSGRFVGQNAIQLHGGIGMSEEYKVGHYFKRMTMLERLLG